ncbi:snoRNA binding domain-containing protein, fibrillarin [Evansella caseinilytica]|uniref:SnoRNA binding domain-containing protein, fibrillarin n=1 Tax=Evansella caseinilytica TaxID=1503961 RepID=A0A1H3H4N2_9BACI|nr:IS110 family transposase [Evansella caseinilytica]SDY10476.1 snoRNA binding domain-containing protein, fibrillarin [Evansella caseinilytica]
MKHVVALDVSMGKSTMVIYNQYRQCEVEKEIDHHRPSFEQLHELLQALAHQDGQAPEIVFEATGVYSKTLERFFQDNGYTYCRINPLEANLQMASMRRQKTDKSDAHELAKSHFRVEREQTYQEESYYQQMRGFTRYYDELNSEITHLYCRLHAILQWSFPELEQLFTKRSALFLNIVQLYPHPDEVLNHSKTVICNRLKANTRKNLSLKRAEEKGIALLEAAQISYPAITKEDVRCEQVKDYARRIADLKEKKEQLVKHMVELSNERIEYQVLRSFPRIGETSAVRIIGELGDIRRFKNHKQLNAYVGIDIMRYQSGNTHYKDKINKRGNNKLRKILFFMIKTMITLRKKTKNHLVEYDDKLKTQPQRKPHKVASIACINKFLKVAFHLITHGIHYDYETASPNSESITYNISQLT